MPSVGKLQPVLGKFYRAQDGGVWCCFRAKPLVKAYGTHTQSMCIRVTDHKINYFLDAKSFDDGEEIDDVFVEQIDEADVTREWLAECAAR